MSEQLTKSQMILEMLEEKSCTTDELAEALGSKNPVIRSMVSNLNTQLSKRGIEIIRVNGMYQLKIKK